MSAPVPVPTNETVSAPPTVNRCSTCRKKVASALVMSCAKCNKKLCVSHIQCEMHNCEHDHKASGKELLRKQLDVGILVDKLERV